MPTEAEKYERCYEDPGYRISGSRFAVAQADVETMSAGLSLLDVGCGRGEVVLFARERGVAAYGVELVRSLCDGDAIVEGSLPNLGWDEGSFDFVSCYDVLEHLPPDIVEPSLDELFRVARRGVFITTTDKRSTHQGVDLHLTRRPREWWSAELDRRAGAWHVTASTFKKQSGWHWRIEHGLALEG